MCQIFAEKMIIDGCAAAGAADDRDGFCAVEARVAVGGGGGHGGERVRGAVDGRASAY